MGSVYFQVTQGRTVRQISTGYRLLPQEWDEGRAMPVEGEPGGRRTAVLRAMGERIGRDRAMLRGVIGRLEASGECTAQRVVEEYEAARAYLSFPVFVQGVIGGLRAAGRLRTAETYMAAMRSFMGFCGHADVSLDSIDSEMIMLYEAYLKGRGLALNTVSFYMRILRAAYNRAVARGLTAQRHPFGGVYTGVEKTAKRAISLGALRRIKAVDLAADASLDFARDMFLFSFYTRGMAFVDMAYLSKTDLKGGVLVYRRHKTGQKLYVKWERCMQEIVDKYPENEGGRLLPIIRRRADERRQYQNALHLVNAKLKKVAARAGVDVALSMYVARHSWASIAFQTNVELQTISRAMGHTNPMTTLIYIKELDNSHLATANHKIITVCSTNTDDDSKGMP